MTDGRETEIRDRAVLLDLASSMVAGGMPANDVEARMRVAAAAVGYPDVQIAASPTGVFLSLRPGGATAFSPGGARMRLDQSEMVNDVRLSLLDGEVDLLRIADRLHMIRHLPHRYPTWGPYVGLALVGMGICLILQPGLPNMLLVGMCSVLVCALLGFVDRHPALAALLPLVAAFVVAVVTFGAAELDFIDGPLRTLICPLAVLLPGALLATGVAELAAGAMVAGSARLTYGLVQLLMFAAGVIAGAMALGVGNLDNVRVHDLGLWVAPLGLAAISVGITLSESLGWRMFRWITPVLVCTYLTQLSAQQLSDSTGVGAFAGAVVASFLTGLIDWLRPRVPAMVAFLPSFWLLVPGTVGLIGITQVGSGGGAAAVIGVVSIVTAIAMGITVGSAAALALRAIRRRNVRA